MRNRSRSAARSAKLILQVSLMLTALVAVVGLMGFFQTPKFKDQIGLLIGAEPAGKAWLWCPQGIHEIKHFPSQKNIQDAHQIGALCSVRMKPSSEEEIAKAQFEPLFSAKGPNSEVFVEASRSGDLFRISGLAFHSKSFRALVDSLK